MAVRRLKPCTCGSNEIITHESGGVVRIICQTCGKEVVHKGEREDAENAWDAIVESIEFRKDMG